MSRIVLLFALISVALCVACGSGSSSFKPKGTFANASLTGQYVYQISGTDFRANAQGSQFREAGVFVADGNGNITGGTDDFQEGSLSTNPISGSYSIGNDGTGQITLNTTPATLVFAVTLVNPSTVYMGAGNTLLNATGMAELQTQSPSVISATPNGTFTFRMHVIDAAQVPTAAVGMFSVSSGAVNGTEDSLVLGGAATSPSVTGAFNAPVSLGRGTGNLNDGTTHDFVYYIVDANNIRFLSNDVNVLGLGRAELQSGTLALSGSYAFGSAGDTSNFFGGVNTVGRFSASGGSISAAALDSVQDGNMVSLSNVSGNYAQTASGRATVTIGGTVSDIFWMVSPSRGFFLVNDSTKVEDGTFDLQTISSFSNSTVTGQFAAVMGGFDASPELITRVGTLQWDGAGHLILNEFVNNSALGINTAVITGSYSVSSNGRARGSISGISNNFFFYLISGTDAYYLLGDTGTMINGTVSKQAAQ
jgi:hypothetical protein